MVTHHPVSSKHPTKSPTSKPIKHTHKPFTSPASRPSVITKYTSINQSFYRSMALFSKPLSLSTNNSTSATPWHCPSYSLYGQYNVNSGLPYGGNYIPCEFQACDGATVTLTSIDGENCTSHTAASIYDSNGNLLAQTAYRTRTIQYTIPMASGCQTYTLAQCKLYLKSYPTLLSRLKLFFLQHVFHMQLDLELKF